MYKQEKNYNTLQQFEKKGKEQDEENKTLIVEFHEHL